MTAIRLDTISNTVLDRITLTVPEGELFVLLGPSGAGKSTLLQVIAGLQPYRGRISFNSEAIDSLPPYKRNVGYLFQDLLLFPHLTVRKNLYLAMTHRHLNRRSRREKTEAILERFGILHLADRLPAAMSGGEQQRAALARAIATAPRILLLDEPFSSLDIPTAERLRAELKRHQRHFNITTLFVTHNLAEARTLGDRLGVLQNGRLTHVGSSADVIPSRFVAESGAADEYESGQCRDITISDNFLWDSL
jgi:ABC-type sugar transport system ATPase subunit